ncbi:MAG: hypothetical protein Q9220_007106 [cf. Caloplaca sp. 1 TL-2023]
MQPQATVDRSQWYNLVTQYTATALTYESDKWLAIAGVARKYTENTGHVLVAGHHWDQIMSEIAWISHSPAGKLPNGAPSWSWLSCRAAVTLYSAGEELQLASLLDKPDQEISTCTWHIMQSPSSRRNDCMQPRSYPLNIEGHARPFRYYASEEIFNEAFDDKFDDYTLEAMTKHVWLDSPLEDGTDILGVTHSYILPYDPQFYMLLLVPAESDLSCWQRVGVCKITAYGAGTKWDNPDARDNFLQAFGPEEKMTIV